MSAFPPGSDALLRVEDLKVHFPLRAGLGAFRRGPRRLRAVDGVSFTIGAGETLGLVGESGAGKSTLARTVLYLQKPTAGRIVFQGQDLATLRPSALRTLRRSMQVVFQDPFASLDPRLTVGATVAEPLVIHRLAEGTEAAKRVQELLGMVGLSSELARRYPHELSGGQRQRVAIARALACEPSFVVCDESVSALDVRVRAQVLDLLLDLQERFGLSYLFIAHDLAVVSRLAHRVAVMYAGKIVELAPRDRLYAHASHPYTRALLSALPIPDPAAARAQLAEAPIVFSGSAELPDLSAPPPGCRYSLRCPLAADLCRDEEPPLQEIAPGHVVACHFWERAEQLPGLSLHRRTSL